MEVIMNTKTTIVVGDRRFQDVTEEKLATLPRSRWNWNRIRSITFWATTFVVVFELIAGSVWNLLQIEFTHVQYSHLGFPDYFAYISGAWQVGGAAVIIAPRFPRLKEWAYAGAFFLWSSAVATHFLRGDYTPVSVWLTPLIFAMFAIASWALRPADRRLSNSGLPPETRPLAWAVPIAIFVLLYTVSFLTLPQVEVAMHERAVKLGWIAR
jgi:DoxX-like family